MATLASALDDSIRFYQQALQQADNGQQFNPGPWLIADSIPR